MSTCVIMYVQSGFFQYQTTHQALWKIYRLEGLQGIKYVSTACRNDSSIVFSIITKFFLLSQ